MANAAKKSATADNTPAVGEKAPAFKLPDQNGKSTSLTDFKGKKVVLYFYPKADTPGCTLESKDFGDRMKEFENADTVILGISKDAVKSQKKFEEKYCLPFTLLSDESGSTCEDYGVWVEKSMYGKTYMGIARTTFLIDEDGKVAKVWPKVSVDGHAEEVLIAAKAI
jgi:thioredoxin-dependent peroxiredoxin